ncbi:hypothetical protein ACI65C_010570 [Semiaphis heraclei]
MGDSENVSIISTDEKLDKIMKMINDMKTTQNKLITSVNSIRDERKNQDKKFIDIEGKLDSISKQFDYFLNENKLLKTKIENLESKISTLEAITRKQARSRNLIFFNVPELPSDSNSNDMQSILEVFRHIDTDVIPVNLLRLGKASNQCRPIRITLPNQHDVFNLLKNKSKLRQTDNFKHVSFSTDRTLLQRKHLKSILDELNLRKSAGDYNLPGLHWSVVNNKIVPDSSNFSSLETNVLSNFSYLNLQQFNVTKNRKNSILDLILSNSPNILVSCEADTLLPIDYLYHPALIVTFPFNSDYQSLYYNELVYDFSCCNYNIIMSQIASLDWHVLFKNECISNAVTIFYNLCILANIPVWFSSTLRDLVFKKKIAHKLYKSTPSQVNYNIFSNLRAKCKFHSKLNYRKYIMDTQNSLKSNPKKFWRFLKSKRSNNSIPSSMTYNNQLISGGKDIVHSFSKYFSSVYDVTIPASASHDPSTISPGYNLSQLNLCSLILNATDKATHALPVSNHITWKLENIPIAMSYISTYVYTEYECLKSKFSLKVTTLLAN